MIRNDFWAEAWLGTPEGALGWWQSTMPSRETKRQQWATNEIMLDLLEELASQPERHVTCVMYCLFYLYVAEC